MMPGTVKGPHACQAYMPTLLPQTWVLHFLKQNLGTRQIAQQVGCLFCM